VVRGEIPVYDTEKRYLRKDGRPVWVHVTSRILTDEQGAPVRTVSVIMDITAAREAQEALKQSVEHFRTLAELIPQIIWTIDTEGRLEYCNPRWREELGQAPLIGEKLDRSTWVHPDDLERTRIIWQDAMMNPAPFQFEHRLKTASGEYRWYLQRALPLRDDANKVIRWIGSFTDVDEQKLNQLEAQQASRSKDEFVAIVSHELRTPLTAILGWTALLRGGGLTSQMIARGTDIIERNAKMQANLVNDLLDMSRIITGKMKVDRRPVALEFVIESAIETVKPAAELKQITLNFSKPMETLMVRGDESRLQQVFWNLLSNAIKFTPENGRVDIRLSEESERVRIDVTDNGHGIPPELLPHVFERFKQGELQPSVQKGLGLGLAIVKHLVELHGGSIDVFSRGEGQGAVFTVALPALHASRKNMVGR
jgi:PAS domain S-box-containing protein